MLNVPLMRESEAIGAISLLRNEVRGVLSPQQGALQMLQHLQQSLGIGFGETTADGVFTLLPTCCLGACGEAPAPGRGDRERGRRSGRRVAAPVGWSERAHRDHHDQRERLRRGVTQAGKHQHRGDQRHAGGEKPS